jgi:aconitate hydratase
MLPFTIAPEQALSYESGDWIVVPDVRRQVAAGAREIAAAVVTKTGREPITLLLPPLTKDDRTEILLDGCLMNYYAARSGKAE